MYPISDDTVKAYRARQENPGWGYCGRCGMPWNLVETHTTYYTTTSGCFPLCEECWTALGCGEARIEYYKALIDHWEYLADTSENTPHVSEDTKRDIMKAVANGL